MIPRIIHFSEHCYFSVVHDEEVARVSIADDHGQEFFAIVPLDGKGYRDRRQKACDAILGAMRRGDPPGEVK